MYFSNQIKKPGHRQQLIQNIRNPASSTEGKADFLVIQGDRHTWAVGTLAPVEAKVERVERAFLSEHKSLLVERIAVAGPGPTKSHECGGRESGAGEPSAKSRRRSGRWRRRGSRRWKRTEGRIRSSEGRTGPRIIKAYFVRIE